MAAFLPSASGEEGRAYPFAERKAVLLALDPRRRPFFPLGAFLWLSQSVPDRSSPDAKSISGCTLPVSLPPSMVREVRL